MPPILCFGVSRSHRRRRHAGETSEIPVHADAASVIEATFTAIAADAVATLVGDALRAAWDGQRFDEESLREGLAKLQEAEPPL